MSCLFCRYFRADEAPDGPWPDWDKQTGQCTRFPVWQAVVGDHYCSELRLEDASLTSRWRHQLDEYSADLNVEKARRKKAETAATKLRAKLKGKR